MEREQILADLSAADPQTRAHAATEAGKLTMPPIARLIEMWQDADLAVRLAASSALALMGNSAPVDAIAAAIRKAVSTRRSSDVSYILFTSLRLRLPYTLLVDLAQMADSHLQHLALRSISMHYLEQASDDILVLLIQNQRSDAIAALHRLGTRASDELLRDIIVKERAALDMTSSDFPGNGISYLAMETKPLIQEALEMLRQRGTLTLLGPVDDLPIILRLRYWQILGIAREILPDICREGLAHGDMDIRAATLQAALSMPGVNEWLIPDDIMAALLKADDYVQLIVLEILAAMRSDAPVDLLLTLVEHPRAKLRQLALQALLHRGATLPHDLMQHLLDDPNEQVRHVAVVGALPHVTIEQFIAALDDHHTYDEIITYLTKLGGAAPVDMLLRFLRDPFTMQFNAARLGEALNAIAPHLPLAPLLDALASPHSQIRVAVIPVLGTFGERAPLAQLVALAQDPDADVRLAVVEAAFPLRGRFPLTTALEWLGDEDYGVGNRASALLGAWDASDVLPPLRRLLHQGQCLSWGVPAIAEHRVVEDLPVLLELLREAMAREQDSDPEQRANDDPTWRFVHFSAERQPDSWEIAKTLPPYGAVAPMTFIQGLLDDPDVHLQNIAVEMLAEAPYPEADAFLVQALEHPNIEVQTQAATSIRRRGSQIPLDVIEHAMLAMSAKVDESADLGQYLISQAGLMAVTRLYALHGGTIIVPHVISALWNRDDLAGSSDDAYDPMLVLSAFGPRAPLAALLASFTSSSWHPNSAIPPILAVTHPDALVALLPEARSIVLERQTGAVLGHVSLMRAIDCLGRLTPFPDALLHFITEALDHPNWQVRWAACDALARIRPDSSVSVLRRLEQISQADDSKWTQRSAQTALQRLRKP